MGNHIDNDGFRTAQCVTLASPHAHLAASTARGKDGEASLGWARLFDKPAREETRRGANRVLQLLRSLRSQERKTEISPVGTTELIRAINSRLGTWWLVSFCAPGRFLASERGSVFLGAGTIACIHHKLAYAFVGKLAAFTPSPPMPRRHSPFHAHSKQNTINSV